MEEESISKSNEINYECETCGSTFDWKSNYRRHLKQKHNQELIDNDCTRTACLHPGCTKEFRFRMKMIEHMIKDHNTELDIANLTFQSFSAFEEWKDEEELVNFVYFSKQSGTKVLQKENIYYYACYRDGAIRRNCKSGEFPDLPVQPFKNGKLKTKTGHVCPARIVARESKTDLEVSVTYFKSHSHSVSPSDLQYHPKYRKPYMLQNKKNHNEKTFKKNHMDQINVDEEQFDISINNFENVAANFFH